MLLNECKDIGLAVNTGETKYMEVHLGGLGVMCSPRYPRFAGSNPAEADGFFSGRKTPEHNVRDFKLGSRA